MAILLTTLKIIGIVILAVLGFLLFLILWLLLWPYTYFINASKTDDISAVVRFSFFFRLVSVIATYSGNEKLNIRLKILGIPLYDKKKRDLKKDKEASVEGGSVDEKEFCKEDDKSEELGLHTEDTSVNDKQENPDIMDKSDTEHDEHEETDNSEKISDIEKSSDEQIESLLDRIKGIFAKIKDFFYKIRDIICAIPDKLESFFENVENKIDSIADTYDYYTKLWNKKGTQYVYELVKKKIIKIIKSLKPYKSKIFVRYGSTDPEKTAKIIEYYSMAMWLLPKKTVLIPDFEDDYLQFDIMVKGHVWLGYIVWQGLSLILNRRFRILIKLLKREEIKNGRK